VWSQTSSSMLKYLRTLFISSLRFIIRSD
jgi:hypothetical protein